MKSRILIVDDEARYRSLYARTLAEAGYETLEAASAEEATPMLRDTGVAMVVSDVRMPGAGGLGLLKSLREVHPDVPCLLVTAYADVREAVQALKLGAVEYLAKPVDLEELLVAVGEALGTPDQLSLPDVPADAQGTIVAASPTMRKALSEAFQVARSDATILITGESGVGKNVLAEFIHRNSDRNGRRQVTVNCAAIPETLIASELFGHEKGAFTGALQRRKGRFREAEGSTLFMDEIGDLPITLQPALLHAIETGAITPVGSDREEHCDVRVIAATNRDLEKEARENRFRRDLYYRINVIAVEIPPLRHRRDDILPLAQHLMHEYGTPGLRLSPAVRDAFMAYDWPGNVRELSNAMQRACLLAGTSVILPEHLPPNLRRVSAPAAADSAGALAESREHAERQAVIEALRQTNGNRTRAAELLDISRRSLLYKLKRYQLTDVRVP